MLHNNADARSPMLIFPAWATYGTRRSHAFYHFLQTLKLSEGVYMRILAPARVSYRPGWHFWFRIALTWWLGHFISRYSKVHFILVKYTCDSKSQTLRTYYPFQSTGRPISHWNVWSFRLYMILLWDFVPEWNSRPGTTTGVNLRRDDSRRHDISWRYQM